MRQRLYQFIQQLRKHLFGSLSQYRANLPYIVTTLLALIVVIVGINGFIELTDRIPTESLATFDHDVTQAIVAHRTPWLTKYFLAVTYLGDVYGYLSIVIVAVLVTAFIFKKWKYVGQVVFVLALSAISNVILKRAIDRARPGIEHLVSVETLSYPSGHAMSAMAFYGFLIFLFVNYKMNLFLKIALVSISAILILSIGISRIYLGVHFPSDIVGGYVAGLIWVIFCVIIFDLIEIFRGDPQT